MTGTMHVADEKATPPRIWATADPATVREIEELLREAETSGRLVYRQIETAAASRSALPPGTRRSTPSCSSPPGWPVARLSVRTAATGLAAAV